MEGSSKKRHSKSFNKLQTMRIFNIGTDISFCVADLRSERTKKGFLSDQSFQALIQWVKDLSCPGVLVDSTAFNLRQRQ